MPSTASSELDAPLAPDEQTDLPADMVERLGVERTRAALDLAEILGPDGARGLADIIERATEAQREGKDFDACIALPAQAVMTFVDVVGSSSRARWTSTRAPRSSMGPCRAPVRSSRPRERRDNGSRRASGQRSGQDPGDPDLDPPSSSATARPGVVA
jgi:hypothetical protein